MHIWPNPSNNMVNVSFTMAEMGNVTVEVYNASGQRISVVADGFTNSGTHTVTWSGADQSGNRVAEGVYFVRMYTEKGESRSQRVLISGN
jgi:flagellar hook assembly protein FlgD